ncbi:MAG TPA: hypothetical protein VK957_12530 [Lunatimonas sp.]|nr:hypothetical protein [Lunatimonas sp.]
MKKTTVLVFVFGLFLFSCMETEDLGPLPIGTWSNLTHETNGFIMERVAKLQDNTLGYRFLSNGQLIHRTYSGWCATPPLVTSDYVGTWERKGDTITIRTPYWGGIQSQDWIIHQSSDKSIQIEILSSEYDLND